MTELAIGYARVSTDEQDLTALTVALAGLGADLARMRTREAMKVATAKGRLRGKQPKLSVPHEQHLGALHQAVEHTNRPGVERAA